MNSNKNSGSPLYELFIILKSLSSLDGRCKFNSQNGPTHTDAHTHWFSHGEELRFLFVNLIDNQLDDTTNFSLFSVAWICPPRWYRLRCNCVTRLGRRKTVVRNYHGGFYSICFFFVCFCYFIKLRSHSLTLSFIFSLRILLTYNLSLMKIVLLLYILIFFTVTLPPPESSTPSCPPINCP